MGLAALRGDPPPRRETGRGKTTFAETLRLPGQAGPSRESRASTHRERVGSSSPRTLLRWEWVRGRADDSQEEFPGRRTLGGVPNGLKPLRGQESRATAREARGLSARPDSCVVRLRIFGASRDDELKKVHRSGGGVGRATA